MHKLPGRILRRLMRGTKNLLTSTQTGRNLLSDLNNRDEFSSLLAHERMLADPVRVESYYQAISRHVTAGSTVVDLGTGTGILAMFAAQQLPRKVYALDHSEFIGVAQEIATHNGVYNIEFVASNSREFSPPEKVDLIIHEQIGDELFTENMIENLLDLKRRILKPGGRILPARFELFVEPVQLKPGRTIPYIWERALHGVDFSCLRNNEKVNTYLPPDYHCYLVDPGAVDFLLCEASPAMTLDLDEITRPEEVPGEASMARTIIRDGYLDGYVVYFRVTFDDTLAFDTSPMSEVTHWRSRLFRCPRRVCSVGEQLNYRFTMMDPADVRTWVVESADVSIQNSRMT